MYRENNLVKNTLFLAISTIVSKGLLFVMIPFFTRWLSVEDYGSFDLYSTYIALLVPIISLASGNALFRLGVESKEDEQKGYITNSLIIYIVNLLVISVLLGIISHWIKLSYFIPFLVLLNSEIFDNYFQGYLRALKKLGLYSICRASTVLITAVAVTLLVKICDFGLIGLMIGYSIGFYFSSALIFVKTKYWKYFRISLFSKKTVHELVSYSWALIPNDISWWIINVSDRQIINMIIGVVANGVYAVACKIPSLCSSIFGVFNVSWQESATDALDDQDKRVFYKNVFDKLLSLLLPICIVVISCNFIFFDYIFDVRYQNAQRYTAMLVIAVAYGTVALFYGGIQISLKRPKENGISTVIGAAVNITVHLSLIRFIGLYAATLSTLISNMVVMYVRKKQLRNDYVFRLSKLHRCLCALILYYSVISICVIPKIWSWCNLILACLILLFANKNIIVDRFTT